MMLLVNKYITDIKTLESHVLGLRLGRRFLMNQPFAVGHTLQLLVQSWFRACHCSQATDLGPIWTASVSSGSCYDAYWASSTGINSLCLVCFRRVHQNLCSLCHISIHIDKQNFEQMHSDGFC